MSASSEERYEAAILALGEFLGRRESGDEVSFDAWCADHPDIESELRALHDECARIHSAVDDDAGLDDDAGAPEGHATVPEAVAHLLDRRPGSLEDLRVEELIASGGMSEIRRVRDQILGRDLAMKTLEGLRLPGGATGRVDWRRVMRFLDEAQITSQLDHPGIVPVHELRLDPDGRIGFTMKLVKGRTLGEIFERVWAGEESWNETRALGVMLRVCEATAYAHRKGVIHRDLKPTNVMVGSFGEVYVMDWGVARVLGRKDAHDIRIRPIRPPAMESVSSVHSFRREQREETPDSSLVTMDGDVVGTPAYMSPEQARGEVERLSARSDVYSIGAMLYHLLSRQPPHVPPRALASSRAILARVLEGPPRKLHEMRPDLPAELEAICERAMARDPANRYADTLELADDLRAYLEHRVVRAYRTGAVAELRKWVQRNRGLATAIGLALLLLVAGSTGTLVFKARSDRNAEEARRNEQRAIAGEALATAEKERAEKRRDELLTLWALQALDELAEDAAGLWPAYPTNVAKYEVWLERAEQLMAELRGQEAELAELRAKAIPGAAAVAGPEPDAAGLEAETATRTQWDFEDARDALRHGQLERLVRGMKAFADEETGLFSAGESPAHGWGVKKRLEFARALARRSVEGDEPARLWSEARASIANVQECPMYAGLALSPQIGLLPLGRDPDSGLWEFAHLATGEPAVRDADGRLVLKEGTGVVLALVPGGAFQMGAQAKDPRAPNYDPEAQGNESPVHEVTLSPFFLSKYEMTQGQWLRIACANPSSYGPDAAIGGRKHDLLHPVEEVSWEDSDALTRRAGLTLPTEAQWEYAARAGTSSVWWCGDDRSLLEGVANVSDSFARKAGAPKGWVFDEWIDDGYAVHAPVGTYAPNAFGLHEVHGNVFEWCGDAYLPYSEPARAGDGARGSVAGDARALARGGSFAHLAREARIALRMSDKKEGHGNNLGLRPARPIERD